MLADVNVLVAAFRKDHPHHLAAAQWLHETVTASRDGQVLRLPVCVISSFLRLVTNSKIFNAASPIDKAIDFADWLLEDSNIRLADGIQEWSHLRKLALDKRLTGNQIPDAHLAALSISLGEPFVTFDKGFRKLLPPSLLVLLVTA